MKYCDDRSLRREVYMAYNTQCTHNNEYNNVDIIKQLVNIRMELAHLLGFSTFAEYKLKKRMAETSDAVYKLLNQLLDAYTPAALKEVAEVEALAREMEGNDFQLMPWDWAYYSEKLKNKKFNLNEEELRPYFELSQVEKGVFGLATRLYGITFKENKEIPVYHPDVKAYEVFDKDGSFLAVLYTDFHPRAGKRSGAWMTSYKEQWIENGVNSRPHVSVTMNFTKPSAGKPALLTFSEVNTFLHEFGHALHGMFANTTYSTMSGTSVYWDFVELPSQIMENFATEKEFLNTFARHYQTGEPIPAELIQKIVDASNFNVAYACLRQVSFGLLDMAWYTRRETFDGDVRAYEKEAWKKRKYCPEWKTPACPYSSHILWRGDILPDTTVINGRKYWMRMPSPYSRKRNLQPGSRCFFSGVYSLERRNGTSDDPLQTLPWTRTQYPCLAEKKWNHQLKTKQYETKVYSLYTNATPFLMELQQ